MKSFVATLAGALLLGPAAVAFADGADDPDTVEDESVLPAVSPAEPAATPIVASEPTPPPFVMPHLGTESDVVTTWNAPVFYSGAIAFGLSYGSAVVAAAASDRGEDDHLFIPIAGPWLDLDDRRDCAVDGVACANPTREKVLLVADGIIQGASAITMAVGLLSPTSHKITTRTAARERTRTRVTPVGGHGLTGIAITGGW